MKMAEVPGLPVDLVSNTVFLHHLAGVIHKKRTSTHAAVKTCLRASIAVGKGEQSPEYTCSSVRQHEVLQLNHIVIESQLLNEMRKRCPKGGTVVCPHCSFRIQVCQHVPLCL